MALMGAFRATLSMRARSASSAIDKIDWKEMDRCIKGWSWSPEVKNELVHLKLQITDTIKRVESMFIEEEHKIDFDAHKKVLPAFVVDLYKKTYEDMKFPAAEFPERAEFEKKFQELDKKAIEADEIIVTRRKEVEAELARLRDLKARLPTLTVDEVLAERPDLKEKIDAEIRANNWDYTPLGSK